jgi:transposase
MYTWNEKCVHGAKILCLLCLTITLIASLALTSTHPGLANAQQNNATRTSSSSSK